MKTTGEKKLGMIPTANPSLIDLVIIDMSETLIQQVFNWESAMVFIPLAFGLAVGLRYAILGS